MSVVLPSVLTPARLACFTTSAWFLLSRSSIVVSSLCGVDSSFDGTISLCDVAVEEVVVGVVTSSWFAGSGCSLTEALKVTSFFVLWLEWLLEISSWTFLSVSVEDSTHPRSTTTDWRVCSIVCSSELSVVCRVNWFQPKDNANKRSIPHRTYFHLNLFCGSIG